MLAIPERIRALQSFGYGPFEPAVLHEKCAQVRALMERRPATATPLVSVVVPAHREERWLLATLRSLAEQRFGDCEFLVISNGEPADNPTQRLAEACGFRAIHDSLGGIARARQTGLLAARGQIHVSTDADTLHSADWLTAIVEILRDPTIRCGSGLVHTLSDRALVRWTGDLMATGMRIQHALSPRLLKGIFEANSFFYRDQALAAGGFDTSLRMGEGIMLFHKLQQAGAPFLFAGPDIEVYTSGRRLESEGPLHWAGSMIVNGIMQTLGSKGLSEKYRGAIR